MKVPELLKHRWVIVALAAVAIWLLVTAVSGWSRLRWEAVADAAVADAVAARAWADSVDQRADSLEALVRANVEQQPRADTVWRTRWRDVAALPVPDTCKPFVAVRDTLIVQADSSARAWERAYRQELVVAGMLRASRDTLRVAMDSLVAVLRDRPRPRKVPDYLSLGPGVTHRGEVGVVLSVNVLPAAETVVRWVGRIF